MERAGHVARVFDDRRSRRQIGFRLTQWRCRGAAARFRPDFVLLFKCHGLALDTIAALIRDRPNAAWLHDPQWYADLDRPPIAHIAAVGNLAATFFVTGFTDEWQGVRPGTRFLPAAGAREIVPVVRDPRFASLVAFIGSAYDDSRADFLAALTKEVHVRVWGPGWEAWRGRVDWTGRSVEGRFFSAVCSSADIVLGVLPARAATATTYASDRLWMSLLAGGFYLGPWRRELEMMLGADRCAWYRDFDDCVSQARFYLANPGQRERIRIAGEAFAREHHTYDARVPFLLGGREWVNPL